MCFHFSTYENCSTKREKREKVLLITSQAGFIYVFLLFAPKNCNAGASILAIDLTSYIYLFLFFCL